MSLFQRLLGARAPRVLGRQDFAQAYVRAAAARFPDARVNIEDVAADAGMKVQWTLPDGAQATQFLGNAYAAYAQAPADLDIILAMHLDAAPAGAQADPATRRASILPVVKTTLWLSASVKQMESAGVRDTPFITDALADDLVTVYVEDRPEAMSYLPPRELETLGVARDTLHSLALENLRRFLPQITVEGQDGRYGVRLDGNYDASMLFLAHEWRDKVEIDGDPVFALPARDELLVCGERDEDGVRALRDMAARIMAQSQFGLSALLYTWRDGRLEPIATR
jgi:uncharacterized protein YtpQ (UPF0354 family)